MERISDIMCGSVVSIDEDEPVIAAARLFKRLNLGALPVTEDAGRLVGMLTDRDIVLRCVAAGLNPRETRTGDIMTRGVVTTAPDAKLSEAAKLMGGDQVRRLPVVEGGKLVGMLSLGDLARHNSMEAASALADITTNLRRK